MGDNDLIKHKRNEHYILIKKRRVDTSTNCCQKLGTV